MDEKLIRFFNKINYIYNEENFIGAEVLKVIVNRINKSWDVHIKKSTPIKLDVVKSLKNICKDGIDDVKTIDLTLIYDVIETNDVIDAIKFYLKDMVKKIPSLISLVENDIKLIDDVINVEITNKVEEDAIKKESQNIIKFLIDYGYGEYDVSTYLNQEKKDAIKREIEEIREDIKVEEEPKFKIIMGETIKSKPTLISDIIGEDNNITVEAFVFGTEVFESSKSAFKILTLKISDKTDSILAKIFSRDADEFKALSKSIKVGQWYRIRGYIKNDNFARDLVFNIRDMEEIESKDISVMDESQEKRIELHAHTTMSQMDGLCDAKALLKQAVKWGHKAIGITDHNGVQSFPQVYHFVTDYNKGKSDEDKFKALYGCELTLIDDSVNIVQNGTDASLLDSTYCVFDVETTGFNAGGADSIIEIGAVLIRNGEIIDRFDELINPGRKLPLKIIELTNITDDMLKDKDDEETVVKRFKDFFKDYPLVAHNAKFDMSFMKMAYKKYGLGELTNTVIDTLELSRALDSGFAKHGLSALVKRYDVPWDETAHHRADYDAEGTALVLSKMLNKLHNQNYETINSINDLVSRDEIHKYGRSYHVNLIAQNRVGLKNLFKIVSLANTKYLYKTPRILRSEIDRHREGILVGAGCYQSEVFVEARSKSEEELTNIINFYDYVEVQPIDSYSHLIDMSDFANNLEIAENLKKIINTTKAAGKLIVASGDVHHISKEDKIYREIIVNQKVPGGGRHPLNRHGVTIPSQHFRTTEEMLENFSFLEDNELIHEMVILNPKKIADTVEIIEVIIETGGVPFSPKIENSEQTVKDLVYGKAHSIYGDPLPELIEKRIESELTGIIKGGFDVIYLIAQKLVKHSNDDGYLVGSRGSVGSSFVATMMGITEVNPLPAHYVCKNCKHTIFEIDGEPLGATYSSGFDLPDYKCPNCGDMMDKQGQDMPFATFLGFDADKVPDIDLNFSGDNQASAHEYTKVLFGVDNVYRAGTIGTVAEKTAYGFVRGYMEEKGITLRSAEIERLASGCTGVKRTTGQHPGGIVVIPGYMDVFDFTPFQFPADDPESPWRTTHFDYHAIDQDVLKLDILGHDDPTVLRMLQDLSGIDVTTVPLDDKDTMSIFSSPEALGVTAEQINCETGSLGVPEFGTKFVIGMLMDTKPTTFSELIKISGLSHGTDVWLGNAQDLIRSGTVEFKDVIGCRDDIMVYLMYKGMEPKKAFKIMEFVRKGKASKDPEGWAAFEADMRDAGIEDWYIKSCQKIKYMFPKAHAAAYVISAFRIAYFKVHYPIYYYSAFFSIRCNDFDVETMIKGEAAIRAKIEEIEAKGFDATNKESNLLDVLYVALEMVCRGFTFKNIDLNKSDSMYFLISEDEKSLIMPFRALDGLGESVASNIIKEREIGAYISIEDVQNRGKVNQTAIEKLRSLGVFEGLPESSQLSLF